MTSVQDLSQLVCFPSERPSYLSYPKLKPSRDRPIGGDSPIHVLQCGATQPVSIGHDDAEFRVPIQHAAESASAVCAVDHRACMFVRVCGCLGCRDCHLYQLFGISQTDQSLDLLCLVGQSLVKLGHSHCRVQSAWSYPRRAVPVPGVHDSVVSQYPW